MENFLEGAVTELEAAKAAIADCAKKEQELKDSERSLKAKQKELEIQRKRVDEKINSAIKKAKNDLERGYDEQINTAEKAIKEAEAKKKTAKAQAVSARMQRENSSLVDENKVLAAEIKNHFKEAGVPRFCNSQLYYSLFVPKHKLDIIICIIAILIFAGLIPFIITRFVNSNIIKILVWIIIVAAFAAIYFLIAAWTKKGERNETLVNMRSLRDRISDNKRFIKKRNKNIKSDPDESQYNLFEYDEQLSMANDDFEKAQTEKSEAIKHFEEEESVAIKDRINEENAPALTQLEKEIDQLQSDVLLRTENSGEASKLIQEYTQLLGEKNMKADKIDELIALINDEKASNIQEALELQKSK